MPNIKSAVKRMRQNNHRRVENRVKRSAMRTYIRKLDKAIESGDRETAQQLLPTTLSHIDKAVHQKLIHKNKAARQSSRLMRKAAVLKSNSPS